MFQPIVDLETGTVVAYEALLRSGSGDEAGSPDPLFESARAAGSVVALDEAAWEMNVRSAEANEITHPHSLLLNVEAETFESGVMFRFRPSHPVVIELTERALLKDPRALLSMVDRARQEGHAIALDDLGAEPASLAFLPLIDPDVVKLDLRLIQSKPDAEVARIMSALNTHAATHDVVVIAEGIENARQLVTARALGATHGQGWYYGRPVAAPLDVNYAKGLPIQARTHTPDASDVTPFSIVSKSLRTRRSDRALLVQMSLFLEARAMASGDSAVLLSTFQRSSNVTADTAARYRTLAEHCSLVSTWVQGEAPALQSTGARVSQIPEGDRLLEEWDIVVLTADFAAVLVACEVDASRHAEGVYDFVVSHDRELALSAARNLIYRASA
jgi:EAL domain-containing protein (putative c-di-GMP-specific phosphodiesterase class I)